MKYIRVNIEIEPFYTGADNLTTNKYLRVICGYPRNDDADLGEGVNAALPGAGLNWAGDTGYLGSANLKTMVVKEDYTVPIGGSVGAVDTAVPGMVKITKTFLVNKKITWDKVYTDVDTPPVELRSIP